CPQPPAQSPRYAGTSAWPHPPGAQRKSIALPTGFEAGWRRASVALARHSRGPAGGRTHDGPGCPPGDDFIACRHAGPRTTGPRLESCQGPPGFPAAALGMDELSCSRLDEGLGARGDPQLASRVFQVEFDRALTET